ncbi:toxin-antitoxin system YwqK family antitoxin [Streptomyces sp. NPDC057638]|uniref:toxin-antitoxin system YwqK family antitoxin n=1 Tax=Streptomyces sp. NPDC057638 TaxID=3346190 RepID=UPI00367E0F17
MTTITDTAPDRPDGVPAEAVAEDDGGWALGVTASEGRTGVWRYWRPDGSFVETSHWRADQLHGEHIRYHDDGTVALEGRWRDGKRCRMVVYRADGPSQETAMDQLPVSVRVMIQDFDEDGYFIRQRFFTSDGSEVDFDGEPIPPRPARVPEGAQHASGLGHWYHQRIEGFGDERKVGLHRFWQTDGAFKGVEYHSLERADGGPCAWINANGRCRSNPLVEADRDGDRTVVEQCLALGYGSSPGAALHAAYEGRAALALRLLTEGPGAHQEEFTDPRTEPERRGGTPDEALWVAGLESWVIGAVDPATGAATGTWRLWRSKPFLGHDQPVVTEFTDGRPSRRREYVAWRPDDLDEEWTYDTDGGQILHRRYEKGVRSAETENLPDGTVAHRRFRDDVPRVERIERDGALVSEVWFAEDGTRQAEVGPVDLRVKGEEIEWWRALDASGTLIAEGAVRPGIKGGPRGPWRLYHADGTDHAIVRFKKTRVRRDGDLGRFAHALHTWRTLPAPEALRGVEKVAWGRYQPFFGAGTEYPFLLKGLAVPDPLAAGHALARLWDGVLHQHTVSDIAGPALRFVIALTETMPDDQELLKFILHVVTRDGSLDATRHLKELHTAATGAKNPARRFAKNGVEPAYHEIYTCLGAATPTWAARAAGGPGISRQTRRTAIHLLAAAPGESAANALRDCLATEAGRGAERDHHALAELLLCLALAPGDTTRDLLEPFLADADPLLRFCAALTWVRIEAAPLDRALSSLTAAIDEPSGLGEFTELWFAEDEASIDAIGALSLLRPAHSQDLLKRMCALLATVGGYTAPGLARSLLDIVFPTEAYAEGAPLTPDQRRVVRVLADRIAGSRVVDIDLNEVLRCNGLPCTADELRALCAIGGREPVTR